MDKKDIEYFRELLTERLEGLLENANDTVSGMIAPKENLPDQTDRASLEADRNFMLRMRDREYKLIKKIKKAIDRIENNTFGICEKCGKQIDPERLEIFPETTLCVDCKRESERLGRIRSLSAD